MYARPATRQNLPRIQRTSSRYTPTTKRHSSTSFDRFRPRALPCFNVSQYRFSLIASYRVPCFVHLLSRGTSQSRKHIDQPQPYKASRAFAEPLIAQVTTPHGDNLTECRVPFCWQRYFDVLITSSFIPTTLLDVPGCGTSPLPLGIAKGVRKSCPIFSRWWLWCCRCTPIYCRLIANFFDKQS